MSHALTDRQKVLVEKYIEDYPHLQEIHEQAVASGDYRTLGNAMAAQPYPSWVNGRDAIEIGRIGAR